jgi:hypothetical protein
MGFTSSSATSQRRDWTVMAKMLKTRYNVVLSFGDQHKLELWPKPEPLDGSKPSMTGKFRRCTRRWKNVLNGKDLVQSFTKRLQSGFLFPLAVLSVNRVDKRKE